jgi:nucleotide-binding universal stress UspA family protein
MTETILVPTDGSDPAAAAARHARLLADALDAEIHVLSVVSGDGGRAPGSEDDRPAIDRAAERGEDTARVAGDRVGETDVREGDPAEEIVAAAEAVGATLITMGTHGRTGVRRFVAGSVTEQVTRLADVPVFTVRTDSNTGSDTPDDYERILLPTDGSACAEAAVEEAIQLARAFDAEIHALSVVDVNSVATQSELTNAGVILDQLKEQSEMAVERVVRQVAEAGIDSETAVLQSGPARGIVDYTEDNGIDVIVMGTHGRSGLGRFLLGSTTERLIRNADVPVLSVRSEEVSEAEEPADGRPPVGE